jgi:hypothetical protein
MNGIDGQRLRRPIPPKSELQGDFAPDASELSGSFETVR